MSRIGIGTPALIYFNCFNFGYFYHFFLEKECLSGSDGWMSAQSDKASLSACGSLDR